MMSRVDPFFLLSQRLNWKKQQQKITDGSSWWAAGDKPQVPEAWQRNVEKGLPYGAEKCVQSLEKIAGRVLQYHPIGRPKE
jgi:hypothetical protein